MKRLSALVLLLAWFASLPVAAADITIGVVSLARLLSEAPQAQQSLKSLQSEFEPRQRAVRAKEEELVAATEELQKNAAIMATDDRRGAELKLREKRRDLGRQQESYLDDFNRRRNEALSALQQLLMEEVQNFAKVQNYDLIVGEGVLYANASVDVTAQILAALQIRYQNDN